MATVNATELVHLTHDGNFQLDTVARVVRCRVVGGGDASAEEEGATTTLSVEITLDVTTMHPRGGGQPSDVGTITSGEVVAGNVGPDAIVATIRDVTIDRSTGVVVHAGVVVVPRDASFFADAYSSPDEVTLPWLFPPGSNVVVRVDPDRRLLNSECHTAGHVVDAAMARCDASLSPVKGYHFADGPYVEYDGKIDARERDAFLVGLRAAFQVRGRNRAFSSPPNLPAGGYLPNVLPRDPSFLNRGVFVRQKKHSRPSPFATENTQRKIEHIYKGTYR